MSAPSPQWPVSPLSPLASVPSRRGDGTNRFRDRMITPPGRSAEMIVYFVHFETINIIPGEQSKGRDIGPLTAGDFANVAANIAHIYSN